MVRIIEENNQPIETSQPKPRLELTYKHQVFLYVLGLVIAESSEPVRQLLEDYSIELSRDLPEEEIADTLILAIGECNADFNRDLASLILDRTLNSSYDQYDFKQFAGQAANILSSVSGEQKGEGQNAPGLLGGLASTIGQIGGIIAQNANGKQASANGQTRQAIEAYRKQQTKEQQTQQSRKNNLVLFLLLLVLGIGILAFITHLKRQAQPIIKTS